jgi:VanZ family protein
MALIFVLSAQQDLDSGLGTLDVVLRKLAHVTVFGALALLWFWTLRPLTRRAVPISAAIALGYAVLDEYHQSFVEGRSGSPLDVGVDAIGVVLACLALRYDRRVRSVLERYGGTPERGVAMPGDRSPADGASRRPPGARGPLRGRGDR